MQRATFKVKQIAKKPLLVLPPTLPDELPANLMATVRKRPTNTLVATLSSPRPKLTIESLDLQSSITSSTQLFAIAEKLSARKSITASRLAKFVQHPKPFLHDYVHQQKANTTDTDTGSISPPSSPDVNIHDSPCSTPSPPASPLSLPAKPKSPTIRLLPSKPVTFPKSPIIYPTHVPVAVEHPADAPILVHPIEPNIGGKKLIPPASIAPAVPTFISRFPANSKIPKPKHYRVAPQPYEFSVFTNLNALPPQEAQKKPPIVNSRPWRNPPKFEKPAPTQLSLEIQKVEQSIARLDDMLAKTKVQKPPQAVNEPIIICAPPRKRPLMFKPVEKRVRFAVSPLTLKPSQPESIEEQHANEGHIIRSSAAHMLFDSQDYSER